MFILFYHEICFTCGASYYSMSWVSSGKYRSQFFTRLHELGDSEQLLTLILIRCSMSSLGFPLNRFIHLLFTAAVEWWCNVMKHLAVFLYPSLTFYYVHILILIYIYSIFTRLNSWSCPPLTCSDACTIARNEGVLVHVVLLMTHNFDLAKSCVLWLGW